MRIIILFFGLVFTSQAQAMCFQSRGYDFASSIDGAVKWLTCLHNEQNEAINEQANIINRQSSMLQEMERRSRDDRLTLSRLASENSRLLVDAERAQININEMRTTIKDLEERLSSVEAAD
ncbi:hypothetical protein ACRQ1B_06245 [Rhizobium panacihumi]|uniref:hypothetical protein n=1 Tax=Rhizobium panacihumi TaxID=2008450 RepID=UPI003D7A06A2